MTPLFAFLRQTSAIFPPGTAPVVTFSSIANRKFPEFSIYKPQVAVPSMSTPVMSIWLFVQPVVPGPQVNSIQAQPLDAIGKFVVPVGTIDALLMEFPKTIVL